MEKTYEYYNPNPTSKGEKKKWHRGDCVIRAFCCALNKSWGTVYSGLCEIGLTMFDMPNSDRVIDAYAKKNGLEKVSLPDYQTLENFADTHSGTYVCRVRNHVVCVKDNLIRDVWNCGKYKVKTVYKKA